MMKKGLSMFTLRNYDVFFIKKDNCIYKFANKANYILMTHCNNSVKINILFLLVMVLKIIEVIDDDPR